MHKINTARIVAIYQKICLVIAIFSISGGILASLLMKNQTIFAVEVFISAYFFIVPQITRIVGLTASFLLSYAILCSALIFWGLMLGPTAQIHILVAFMIGMAWFILNNKLAQWIAVGFNLAMVVFLEVSYYKHWFEPLDLAENVQMFIRWIVVVVGSVLNVAIIYMYYTEWVNARVNKLVTDLERANNFKRIFIYQVTHDIRTQLNAIYYLAQLFKREITLDQQLNKIAPYNNLLFTAVNNASRIINNVLDMSKIEAGKMEDVQEDTFLVTPFFETLLQGQQVTAKTRKIQLRLAVDENMPEAITCDYFKLSQVVTNLLNNAIKYGYKNSTVYVKVKRAINGMWSIAVVNKGPGIPFEKLESIFDQFVAKKHNRYTEGTGLGLYIVKNMIDALQGDVSAESQPGGDTVFTVTLKLQPAKPTDIPDETEEIIDLSNIRILVADDNEMNNMLFSRYLSLNGCFVTSVSTGREVLNKLESDRHLPDIILMDHHMPEMDGAHALIHLKKDPMLKHIPVIICTGSFESQDELMAAGAAAIVIKPVDQKTLFSVISKHLPHLNEMS
jgi:signal transduction histidine kinase/CheY-like chemotaxis protein